MGTHNRAGEITLKQIDDFTYELLLQTFTYSRGADRPKLEIQWGDGSSVVQGGLSMQIRF